MKEGGWYETYVHFSNDREQTPPQIYQSKLDYGRERVWPETYNHLSHHNKTSLHDCEGRVAGLLRSKSTSSIIITTITS